MGTAVHDVLHTPPLLHVPHRDSLLQVRVIRDSTVGVPECRPSRFSLLVSTSPMYPSHLSVTSQPLYLPMHWAARSRFGHPVIVGRTDQTAQSLLLYNFSFPLSLQPNLGESYCWVPGLLGNVVDCGCDQLHIEVHFYGSEVPYSSIACSSHGFQVEGKAGISAQPKCLASCLVDQY